MTMQRARMKIRIIALPSSCRDTNQRRTQRRQRRVRTRYSLRCLREPCLCLSSSL
jgi:hypothetical protein